MLKRDYVISQLQLHIRPLAHILGDPEVTEVMINPRGRVFVERAGIISHPDITLSEGAIVQALMAVGKLVHRDCIPNSEQSIIDASIHDLRLAGAQTVSPGGSFLTIRKHQDGKKRPTIKELVQDYQALSQEQADVLIRLLVKDKKNLIIAGGTGSGKTTIANALLGELPLHERVITIEDTKEFSLKVPDWVDMVTNPKVGLTARLLVKLAMRSRPDRLVLGETRGDETFDLIRAFNSGHDGGVSTVHASDPWSALEALEMLFAMSVPAGSSIPSDMVRQYIAKSVNVVLFAGRRIEQSPDGLFRTVRRVENILIIKGVKNGYYDYEEIKFSPSQQASTELGGENAVGRGVLDVAVSA